MNGTRKPMWTYLATVGGGLLAVTLGAFWQYGAKMHTFTGYAAASRGSRAAVASVSEGMFGTILIGILLGFVVLVAVFVATYVTSDVRAGIALSVLAFVPLAVANTMLFRYVSSEPIFAAAQAGSLPHVGEWYSAIEMTIFPGLVGVVAGYFAAHFRHQMIERESHRRILSREELAELDAKDRARAAGGTPASRVADQPAAAPAQPATAQPAAVTTQSQPDVPQPAAAPAQPATVQPAAVTTQSQPAPAPSATPAGQRRAITCRRCGTSNAPIRSHCLSCGTALG